MKPELVTTARRREPRYPGGITYPLFFMDAELNKLIRDFPHEFTFPSNKSPGVELYNNICDLIEARRIEEAKELIEEIKQYCVPTYKDLPEVKQWAHMAVQMPSDWGPVGRNHLKNWITKSAKGKVLELMCGFESYIGESDSIEEVVAVDYCREALEIYDYPKRKRVLFDMNAGKPLPFNQEFDTVGIFSGITYLDNPKETYTDIHRILFEGGKLLIANGVTCGYADLQRRDFNPQRTADELVDAKFDVTIKNIEMIVCTEGFYFIEALKTHQDSQAS